MIVSSCSVSCGPFLKGQLAHLLILLSLISLPLAPSGHLFSSLDTLGLGQNELLSPRSFCKSSARAQAEVTDAICASQIAEQTFYKDIPLGRAIRPPCRSASPFALCRAVILLGEAARDDVPSDRARLGAPLSISKSSSGSASGSSSSSSSSSAN